MFRLLTVAGAAVVALSLASGAYAADKPKVCFVYIGPHNDGGWTQAHDVGRQLVDKELGDKVETSYVENVPEGPDAERVRVIRGQTAGGQGHERLWSGDTATGNPRARSPDHSSGR